MSAEVDLVERARRGDPDAWRELYESLTGRLLTWLRTRPSGDSAVSPEDIAAETWLVAAQRLAHFAGDSSDFAGWLFGIARNLATNTRRRSLRRSTDPHPVGAEPHWGTHDTLATDAGGVDWVRRTLAELPRREAEVLALTEVVGLDVATTAAVLDMTGTAVRVARHRGLARLRRATPAPVVATTPAAPAGAASATSPVPAQAAPSRLETLLAPETV